MTKHFIGTVSSGPDEERPSRPHHRLNFLIELTSEQAGEVSNARETIAAFVQDTQMFMVISWNYTEFTDLITTYLEAYVLKKQELFEDRPLHINLNRSFINLLSSVRFYLDYMDRRMLKRYGSDSDLRMKFKKYCSTQYDSNFSYRFLYKLRNYSQHAGFPIGGISMGVRPSRADPRKPHHFLILYIDRDSILRDFDWQKLKKEIESQPPRIDPVEHSRSLMESLSTIHRQVISDVFGTLQQAAGVIVEYGERIKDADGSLVIFELEGDPKDMQNVTQSALDIEFASRIANGTLEDVVLMS